MNSFETEWESPEFESVASLAENMIYLLPGCDDAMVRLTLQEAYRGFCRDSGVLRTWRKLEVDADGKHAGPVAPVLSGEIDCVTEVLVDGVVPHKARGWKAVGDPPLIVLPVPAGVTEPDGENIKLLVETVEIPHMREERAPKPFLRRYGDAIKAGALFRLYTMAGRPWSDAEQARQRGIEYSNAVSEARQRGMEGGAAMNAGAQTALDFSSMV